MNSNGTNFVNQLFLSCCSSITWVIDAVHWVICAMQATDVGFPFLWWALAAYLHGQYRAADQSPRICNEPWDQPFTITVHFRLKSISLISYLTRRQAIRFYRCELNRLKFNSTCERFLKFQTHAHESVTFVLCLYYPAGNWDDNKAKHTIWNIFNNSLVTK